MYVLSSLRKKFLWIHIHATRQPQKWCDIWFTFVLIINFCFFKLILVYSKYWTPDVAPELVDIFPYQTYKYRAIVCKLSGMLQIETNVLYNNNIRSQPDLHRDSNSPSSKTYLWSIQNFRTSPIHTKKKFVMNLPVWPLLSKSHECNQSGMYSLNVFNSFHHRFT